MKKIICFTVLLSSLLIMTANAQEFDFYIDDSVSYGNPGGFIIVEGHLTNLSLTNSITVKMVRLQNILPDTTWFSSMCFGACVSPEVDSIAWTIAPDTSEFVSVDFFPGMVPATASVLIKFATISNSQEEKQWFIGSTMPNSIPQTNSGLITDFRLLSNYPNPFNNQTVISAEINSPGKVTLHIYDVLGREVYTDSEYASSAGEMTFRWNGVNYYGAELSSGVYMYRLSLSQNAVQKYSNVNKLTLLR